MHLGLGLGFSRYVSLNNETPKQLGAFAWYNFKDSASLTLSGTSINAVADKTGNGHSLEALGTAPTYDASLGAVFTAGVDDAFRSTETASTWDFLHNLSDGCTVFIKFNTTRVANNVLFTNANNKTTTTLGMYAKHLTASGGNPIQFNTANGTSSVRTFNTSAGDTAENTNILACYLKKKKVDEFYDFQAQINGANSTVSAQSGSNAFSNTTATTLHIGRYASATDDLGGSIAEMVFFDRRLTQPEINQMVAFMNRDDYVTLTARPDRYYITQTGQSNSAGLGLISESSDYISGETFTGAKIFNPSANNWIDYELGVNSADGSTPGGGINVMGADAGMFDELVTRSKSAQNFYLMKYASGGLDIDQFISGGSLYDQLVQRQIRAVERIEADGFNVIGCLAWDQGENDSVTEILANAYGGKLPTFFNDTIVANMRGWGVTRFTMTKIQPTASGFDFKSTVSSALEDFCSSQSGGLFLDRPVTFNVDGIHYNADTQTALGKDQGAWFIDGVERYNP